MEKGRKKVFVTVGTTSFDELVTSATDKALLNVRSTYIFVS